MTMGCSDHNCIYFVKIIDIYLFSSYESVGQQWVYFADYFFMIFFFVLSTYFRFSDCFFRFVNFLSRFYRINCVGKTKTNRQKSEKTKSEKRKKLTKRKKGRKT